MEIMTRHLQIHLFATVQENINKGIIFQNKNCSRRLN